MGKSIVALALTLHMASPGMYQQHWEAPLVSLVRAPSFSGAPQLP